MRPHPEITPWFFATWIVLAVFNLWSSFIDRNVTRKKRLLPVFIIGSGTLFVIFVFLITGDLRITAFAFVAVELITILNLHLIRICSACGRTVYNRMSLT